MFGRRLIHSLSNCCACLIFCCICLHSHHAQAAELKPIKASKFKVKARPGNGNNIADIESVNFYVTDNGGESWSQIDAANVVTKEGAAPYFVFTAPKDGTYGFWIQVLYKNGQADKAPQVGSVAPTNRLIDTTVPSIDNFLGGLIAGTDQKLFLEWAVSDKHLSDKPVSIEISTDQGAHWSSYKSSLAAEGKDSSSLPQKLPFDIRLSVIDLAGNKQVSKPISIGQAAAGNNNTNSQDTEKETGADTKTFTEPAIAKEDAPAPKKDSTTTLPSLDEVEKDVDAELAQQKNNEPAPAPKVPENHQDIVAPYADKPWPKKYTGEIESDEISASSDAEALAKQPARLIEEDIALILKRREGRILFGKDAEQVLDAARHAVKNGNNERATVLYARLKDSTVASESLPEEIELHLRLDRLDIARELVRTAPPEVRNTKMRIQQASLLIVDNKRKRAISLLTGIIPDETDDYRNAQLLLARCYIEENKNRSALNILRPLAQRTDSWGQAAQTMIDQMK